MLGEGCRLRRSIPNRCNGRAKFLFTISREIDKNAESACVGNSFRGRSSKLGNNCNHLICNGIEFPGLSWDCDFAYAQSIWRRRERRCLLDGFGDLLPHLSLKQRAVRLFAFVPEDEIKTDPDVHKHENHECNADPDTHFAALLWNVR